MNNKAVNAFAERIIDIIANSGPPVARDGTTEVGVWPEPDIIKMIRTEAGKTDYQEPNTERLLDLSTAHLSPTAKRWLDECGWANAVGLKNNGPISTMGLTMYGYFMYAPEERGHGMPEELFELCRAARSRDCAYILFDADGPMIEGLLIFDDDERRIEAEADDAGLADELDDLEPGKDTNLIKGIPVLSTADILKLLQWHRVDRSLIDIIVNRLLKLEIAALKRDQAPKDANPPVSLDALRRAREEADRGPLKLAVLDSLKTILDAVKRL